MISFLVTFFRDYAAQTREQRQLSAEQLATLIRDTAAPSKAALPWLKLARFGNAVSRYGSLRQDRNVLAVTGIEADYDGEQVAFDVAVDVAAKAGLSAVLYTSPSHAPARPRWRVLCPTSREYLPKERARLLGRLNGLYGGVFGRESWTLSQSYYFGAVAGTPAHRVRIVDGAAIDQLHELDEIWLGPPVAGVLRSARSTGSANDEGAEARADAELVRGIVTGEGYHTELCALAARYLGRGMDQRAAAEVLRGLMLAQPPEARDSRWRDRMASIASIVRSAAQKFAPEADHRRAIARLTHRMVRQRRSGDEIKEAISGEATRLDLAADIALAIGAAILRDGGRYAPRQR